MSGNGCRTRVAGIPARSVLKAPLYGFILAMAHLLLVAVVPATKASEVLRTHSDPTDRSSAASSFGEVPFSFIENVGQWNSPARFVASADNMLTHVLDDGLVLHKRERDTDGTTRSVAVRLTFEGTSRAVLSGTHVLPGKHNYFLGSDPREWTRSVSGFREVEYRDLYDGVDLRLKESAGHLEYDLLLDKGANVDQIVVRCDGVVGLDIGPDGSLIMETGLGSILQKAPTTWYELPGGNRQLVRCRYRKIDDHRYGFEVPGRSEDRALVIDPVIEWSTYLGGDDEDGIFGAAFDQSGNLILAGYASSTDFPSTTGVYDETHNGGYDWFIAGMDTEGTTLLWSTFLGGSGGFDVPFDVEVDDDNRVVVCGIVNSADFPITPGAFDFAYAGETEAAVACLTDNGATLVYSTFLGGRDQDFATELATQGTEVVVCGYTRSSDFVTTAGAYDTIFGGSSDIFVTRLNGLGTGVVYSTLVGGNLNEGLGWGPSLGPWSMPWYQTLALDSNGDIFVGGITNSSDFPTTIGAYDRTFNGDRDAFLCKLDSAGTQLLYGSFLGGSDRETVSSIDVDELGRPTIVGHTLSPNFPTTPGAFEDTFGGPQDPFVAQFDPQGNDDADLIYSTYLTDTDSFGLCSDVEIVDETGDLIVVGRTQSDSFPTTAGAFDQTQDGPNDAFILWLDPSGTGAADLLYSTYVGADGYDEAYDVIQDADGTPYVVGSAGPSFPVTSGSYDTTFNNPAEPLVNDGFVLRFGQVPAVVPQGGSGGALPAPLSTVSPNPTRGSLRYSLDLDRSTTVQVDIIDVSGRRMQSLVHEEFPEGHHSLSAELAPGTQGIPSGIYYLRLRADGQQWVREFALVR